MLPAREPVTVKLYGNERLYRGDEARYPTRADLLALMRRGTELVVRDAASGTDITRSILGEGTSE